MAQPSDRIETHEHFDAAANLLTTAIREFPKSATAHGLLGAIYLHELNKPVPAVDCYRKAAQISPKSKQASLGLFHSLWELDKQEEAIGEMKRFQSICHCQDYDEILAELTESGLS